MWQLNKLTLLTTSLPNTHQQSHIDAANLNLPPLYTSLDRLGHIMSVCHSSFLLWIMITSFIPWSLWSRVHVVSNRQQQQLGKSFVKLAWLVNIGERQKATHQTITDIFWLNMNKKLHLVHEALYVLLLCTEILSLISCMYP